MINLHSRTGTYHQAAGGENQDALCSARSRTVRVISLADGVSSCAEAKTGAEIASRAVTDLFSKRGERLLSYEPEQISAFTLSHILYELNARAKRDNRPVEDYSSTVASVLADRKTNQLLCVNLGDGIILATGNGTCQVLSMPGDSRNGCCVTTTEGAERRLSVRILDALPFDSVLICSDGAWRQMFEKNKLKPEISALLIEQRYEELETYLNEANGSDDCSFIAMELRKPAAGRRKAS